MGSEVGRGKGLQFNWPSISKRMSDYWINYRLVAESTVDGRTLGWAVPDGCLLSVMVQYCDCSGKIKL